MIVFVFLHGYKQQVAQFNFENRCTAIMPLVEAGSAVTSTEATLESAVTSTEAMESAVTSTASAGRPTNATIQAQPLCINFSLVSAIPGWQTCCKLCFQSNGQYHSERCKAALAKPQGEPVPISHDLAVQLARARLSLHNFCCGSAARRYFHLPGTLAPHGPRCISEQNLLHWTVRRQQAMADEGDDQVHVDNQEAQEPDEPGVVDNLPM